MSISKKELPELTGSIKQIKYAESIRDSFMNKMSDLEETEEVKQILSAIRKKIKTETSASFWINNKDFDSFYKSVAVEVKKKNNLLKAVLAAQKAATAANAAEVYINGSYDDAKKIGGYGIILISDEHVEEISETITDPDLLKGGNISVKMAAAMKALNLCVKLHIGKVVLYHDLKIFESLTRKESQPKDQMTKQYKKVFWELKDKLTIEFKKVEPLELNEKFSQAKESARFALGKIKPMP